MAEFGRPKRKASAKAAIKEDDTSASVSQDAKDEGSPVKKARGGKKKADPEQKPDADAEMKDEASDEGKPKKAKKAAKAAAKPKAKAATKPAAAADAEMKDAEEKKEKNEEDEKPKAKKAAKAAAKPTAKTAEDRDEDGNNGPSGPLVLPAGPAGSEGLLKIVSWNVNGLNACMEKPGKNRFVEYINAEQPDVLCVQETKINGGSEPKNIVPGYTEIWNCSTAQKGYAGTAVFTKIKPESITMGIGEKEGDAEGRAITMEFKGFFLVNTYVPNSGMRLDRLDYRTSQWDTAMLAHLKALHAKGKPVFWCGDLNVAHEEIDLANPKTNKKTPGFTNAERASFSAMLKNGPFVDSWRKLNPTLQEYTFYSYKRESRKKNIGWRLDYFVVSPDAMTDVKFCFSRQQVYGSDHIPLVCLVPRTLAA